MFLTISKTNILLFTLLALHITLSTQYYRDINNIRGILLTFSD